MKQRPHRLGRIKAVEREYRVARLALTNLNVAARIDPTMLAGEELKPSDAASAAANLEMTFLLRLFAEFEATLREVWDRCFRQTTTPPMRDLIDSVAARRTVPDEE